MVCVVGVTAVSLLTYNNAQLAPYHIEPTLLSEDELERNMQNNLMQDLNEAGIPGIQVSIIHQGQSYNLSLGTVDYDRTQEITGEHLLRIGSVTKIYTAAIIMKLYEEGLLPLDTTIEEWFPELPNAQLITVKNLLNHTSGIYNYTENWPVILKTTFFPQKTWEPDEIYQCIIKGKPYFAPGEKHCYSNSNYLLLGLLAEQITGKKYQELLNEIILDPLQLNNTYILPDDELPELLISGYDREMIPMGIHEMKPDHHGWASMAYSAGGIAASAADLSQFLQGLFTYKIISKETLAEMMEFGNFSDEDIPEQTGYGLGLRRLMIEGDTLIGHTGTIPGFGAAAFYCPEKDYYIAILGNVSFLDQQRLLSTIVKNIHTQTN